MKQARLDATDIRILRIMQSSPELNIHEIGERVGLSHTPCWRRLRRLRDSGVVCGRVWLLDPEQVGLDVTIFVSVRLKSHTSELLESFEQATLDIPEILQCYSMSGEFDYLLRVVVASEIKRTTCLPI
ncbi:MAG: Lrp/AsnC family transcriptional regulator [Thiothrix sp.]|nr:Lrp/AsnC family transcriptional regulator [Thiothrix sp.]